MSESKPFVTEEIELDGVKYAVKHFVDAEGKPSGDGVIEVEQTVQLPGERYEVKYQATGASYRAFIAEIDKRKALVLKAQQSDVFLMPEHVIEGVNQVASLGKKSKGKKAAEEAAPLASGDGEPTITAEA